MVGFVKFPQQPPLIPPPIAPAASGLSPELSVYLDLVRIFAALAVFQSHVSVARLSGGFLWQLNPIGHDGVMVFFVLSGFVIQWVASTRETTYRSFQSARLARLYTVVVPALLLTVLCDAIGMAHNPAVYVTGKETVPILRFVANLLFFSQSWGWDLGMLSNDAFWSLPFEFWYYQMFAAAVFLRGWLRWGVLALCMLVAGPGILLYAPIWGAGALAYHASTRLRCSPLFAAALWWLSLFGLIMLLGLDVMGTFHRVSRPDLPPRFAWVDFLTGALVAIHLFAASYLRLPGLRWAKLIAAAAGLTFALYLFHLPLLHLAAAWIPTNWPAHLRGPAISVFTLVVVVVLGQMAERFKPRWRAGFERVLRIEPDFSRK
jgi:peptidoglycan/LPS O-acetylase OafA/YrhL